MTYDDIIRKVSEDLNLPLSVVSRTYRNYWRAIRDIIEEQPLKIASEEEFDNLKTSFNIPSLGKLYCAKKSWIVKRNCYKKNHNVEDN